MRNYRIQTVCATGAFTLAMAIPALADSEYRVTRQMLSEADRIAIFGRDSNFQVALLTEDEMAETKGEYWAFLNHWAMRAACGSLFWGMLRGADMQHEDGSL